MPMVSNHPTADDWEDRRTQVTRLYRDEGKTLRQVMSIVNTSNFQASVKMYKARIKIWGLDKKNKEHEARAIVHAQARRHGKATEIRLRGHIVNFREVRRYFRRKKISLEEVLATEAIGVPELACKTPAQSPKIQVARVSNGQNFPLAISTTAMATSLQGLIIPSHSQRLRSPDSFRAVENLLTCVQNYIFGSIRTGHWLSQGPDDHVMSTRQVVPNILPHVFFQGTRDACSLFDRKRPGDAVRVLAKAFDQIKLLVQDQSPEAFPYLARSIALLLVKGQTNLVVMLCEQMCGLTAIEGYSNGDAIIDTFGQIFKHIKVLTRLDQAHDYLLAAMRCWADSFRTELGQAHLQTVQATANLTRTMTILHGSLNIADSLQSLHQRLHGNCNGGNLQSVLLLHELIDVNLACGQFEAAELSTHDIIRQAPFLSRGRRSVSVYVLAHAYAKVSNIRALQGDYHGAEIYSQHAWALLDQRNDDFYRTVTKPDTCLWRMLRLLEAAEETQRRDG